MNQTDNNQPPMKTQAQLQEDFNTIQLAAQTIYDLMPAGAGLTVDWLVQPKLITPGARPERRTLVITKPTANMNIQVKLG